jgi:hypothetical protein
MRSMKFLILGVVGEALLLKLSDKLDANTPASLSEAQLKFAKKKVKDAGLQVISKSFFEEEEVEVALTEKSYEIISFSKMKSLQS